MPMSLSALARWLCLTSLLPVAGFAAGAVPGPPSTHASIAKLLQAPPQVLFPALDVARLTAEDAQVTDKSAPYRYAVGLSASGLRAGSGGDAGGSWTTLPDGRLLWRFEVEASAAKSVELRFQPYRMPHGAELWVYTPDRNSVAGPYDERHNNTEMVLATPALPGSRAVVEVVLPAAAKRHLALAVEQVYSGYRGFDFIDGHPLPVPKSGDCNVDTVCPQGNNFRDQIQSVVRYTVSGGLCTGTLVNNTANDGSPLLLTARHCFSSQNAAAGVVAYYNYASPTCRTVGTANNGTPLDPSISSHTQTGTTLLASSTSADFTLVRFNQAPPAGANVYLAGWDRRNLAPSSATGIHHPSGDEKRISGDNNPLSITTQVESFQTFSLATGHGLRVNDWDFGTTEQGSSGSALFSPERRVIGTLSGGNALCGNDLDDVYGRLFVSFTGGGTSSTRLVDHLDPTGSGVQTLDGRFLSTGGTPLSVTLSQTPATARAAEDVNFTANVSGTPPYTVAWDLDGDGVADRTISGVPAGSSFLSLTTRYSREQTPTARVTVVDAANNSQSATRAVDVQSHVVSAAFQGATQVCGDGDANFDPGERWRATVGLTNFGDLPVNGGLAIFSRSLFAGPGAATDFQVVTPAVAVSNLSTSGSVQTEFHIKSSAQCGAQFALTYQGTMDLRGTSGAAVSGGINIPATCNVVSNCATPSFQTAIRQGAYFNPARGGNGLVSFIVPQQSGPPIFFALWFTGEANRQPTWYFIQDSLVDGQVSGNVVRRTRNVAVPGFVTSDAVVGTAQITLNGNESMLFTYQLNGQPRSGEPLTHLLTGLQVANPNRTGAWFFDQEGGWGQTYDSYLSGGISTEFGLTYVYDSTGFPRWVLTQDSAGLTTFQVSSFQTHCPNCNWLDIAPTSFARGSLARQFGSRTTGTLSTNFAVPGGGNWVRNNVPIQLLTTQQPP